MKEKVEECEEYYRNLTKTEQQMVEMQDYFISQIKESQKQFHDCESGKKETESKNRELKFTIKSMKDNLGKQVREQNDLILMKEQKVIESKNES